LCRARAKSQEERAPFAGSNRPASFDGDEHLLDDVLGEAVGARHLVGQGVEGSGIAGVEGLDRPLILLANPDEKRGLLGSSFVDRRGEGLSSQARLRRGRGGSL
jgi:hypothetical protein